jgi:hypothetical protein
VPGRPSYASIVAHLALVVALSGGAVAAVTISGANIKDGSVTGADVKKGSLTGTDLKKNSIALDRISKSLPLQYYSRAQSNAKFLGAKAAAADAAKLGGLPAASYAKGTVTTTANRVDVTVGATTYPTVLDVPGFARVQVVKCDAGGASAYLLNTSSGSIAWLEDNARPGGYNGDLGTAWLSAQTPVGSTSWLTAHVSKGSGNATQIADISIHDDLSGGSCAFVVQATVYG